MKFKSFLVAALAMVAFASCSKDNGGTDVQTLNGESAEIKVTLSLPQAIGTRAVTPDSKGSFNDGDIAAASRLVLENFAIFSLSQGGEILDKEVVSSVIFSSGEFETTFSTVNTAKTIYLVGNYGDGTYSDLPATGTLNDLLAKLQNQSDIDQTSTDKNLIIAGVASVGTYTEPALANDPWTATASITPIPVSTKLNVTVKNQMKNYTGVQADEHYTITNVAVLYSAKQSRIFSPATVAAAGVPYAVPYSAGKYYLSGLDAWAGANDAYTDFNASSLSVSWPTTFDPTSFSAVAGEAADQTFLHTFYVYPGAIDGPKPMIVVVRAESAAAGKEPLYYNIILDEANGMSGISPDYKYPSNGRLYQITFNIGVDASTGGGGVPDPEETTEDANITVTVKSAEWVVVGGISETW